MARRQKTDDGPIIVVFDVPADEDRDVIWRSGTGRVIRAGDYVKVDGLRGNWQVAPTVQPFLPDAVQVYDLGPAGNWLGHTRTIAPERLHVRRNATGRAQARAAA